MADSDVSKPTPPDKPSRPLVLLAVALVAVAAVLAVYLLHDPGPAGVVEQSRTVESLTEVPTGSGEVEQPSDAERDTPRVGDVFEGLVLGEGSRGDGQLRVRGRTVYVPGARRRDTVRFRLTEDRGNFLLGVLVTDDIPLTVLAPLPRPPVAEVPADTPVLDAATSNALAVQPGAVFRVVIEDRDRFNPERNAFCRIGGFAVVVENAQPEPDPVTIRIRDRQERRALAEVVQMASP